MVSFMVPLQHQISVPCILLEVLQPRCLCALCTVLFQSLSKDLHFNLGNLVQPPGSATGFFCQGGLVGDGWWAWAGLCAVSDLSGGVEVIKGRGLLWWVLPYYPFSPSPRMQSEAPCQCCPRPMVFQHSLPRLRSFPCQCKGKVVGEKDAAGTQNSPGWEKMMGQDEVLLALPFSTVSHWLKSGGGNCSHLQHWVSSSR